MLSVISVTETQIWNEIVLCLLTDLDDQSFSMTHPIADVLSVCNEVNEGKSSLELSLTNTQVFSCFKLPH